MRVERTGLLLAGGQKEVKITLQNEEIDKIKTRLREKGDKFSLDLLRAIENA